MESQRNNLKQNAEILHLKSAKKLLNQKIKSLNKQLANNRIFLNMVIHDMRNPSNSAEFGIQESLNMIKEATSDLKQFTQNLKHHLSGQGTHDDFDYEDGHRKFHISNSAEISELKPSNSPKILNNCKINSISAAQKIKARRERRISVFNEGNRSSLRSPSVSGIHQSVEIHELDSSFKIALPPKKSIFESNFKLQVVGGAAKKKSLKSLKSQPKSSASLHVGDLP